MSTRRFFFEALMEFIIARWESVTYWSVCVCVCTLRGPYTCVCSIVTGLYGWLQRQGTLTLLWRSAFLGTISSIRLILVARVKKRLAPFNLLCTFPQRKANLWCSGWAWARKKRPSCFLAETSSSDSKKGSCFMLRLNVSRTRSSSLREIEWPQRRERNIVLRPGFSEAILLQKLIPCWIALVQ